MGKLSRAVQNWIEAEYMFRNAYPHRYSTLLQDKFIEATEALREALTGRGDLEEAAQELGLPVERDNKAWAKWFRRGGGFHSTTRPVTEDGEGVGPRVRLKEKRVKPKERPDKYSGGLFGD